MGQEARDTTKPRGLSELINRKIEDKLYTEKKPRKFLGIISINPKEKIKIKVPKEKKKRGYIATMIIRSNRSLDIKNLPIQNGMIQIIENGTWHRAEGDCIMDYKGNPVMIVPEWSSEPLTATFLQEQAQKLGTKTEAQLFTIKAIEQANLGKPKMKISGKTFLFILGGIAIAYIIYQYFLK
jgi:hypothetical protein